MLVDSSRDLLGGGGNRAEKHENDIGQRYFCNYCPKLKMLNLLRHDFFLDLQWFCC